MRDRDMAVIGIGALLLLGGGARMATPRPGDVTWIPSDDPMAQRDWSSWWAWPLPILTLPAGGGDFRPVISQEWKVGHYGVDLMYRRKVPGIVDKVAWPPGTTNGSVNHFCPPGTPVLAAKRGKVWSVERTKRGIAVVLDHGPPWATFYQHLDTCNLPWTRRGKPLDGSVGREVEMGAAIGTAGADPLDGQKLRHLHFACWYKGAGDAASVNPQPGIDRWGARNWAPITIPR